VITGACTKPPLAGRRDEALAYVLNPGTLRKVSLTSIRAHKPL